MVALCTAGTSTLADAYRYDGFGQQIASTGTAVNTWRYRGLLNIGSDALTWALLDMGARDYAAQLGQFTQADSVQGSAANPLSMNRFLYALANPATLIDQDGHRVTEYEDCKYGDSCTAQAAKNQTCYSSGCGGTSSGRSGGSGKKSSGGGGGDGPVGPGHSGDGGGGGVAPTFTGMNPWALQQDPMVADVLDRGMTACSHGGLSDPDCQTYTELQEWLWANEDIYCSWHRAECDAYASGQQHTVLGGLGMIPVIGIVFNSADALLYASQGDTAGAVIALGTSLPIAGAVGRVGWGVDKAGSALQLAPSGVRFSQKSVNEVGDLIESMRLNGWQGDPIDVVRMADGGLTSVDNSRLLAAHYAGIDVKALVP